MVLNGSTGTTDTLAIATTLGAAENINFQTYFTNGILVGIERVSVSAANIDNSAHTLTLATGLTGITVDSNNGAEDFTITGTAAQANALVSIIDTTGTGDTNLTITTSGTVDYSGDTITNLDTITYGLFAVDLTLANTAVAVTQTGAAAGTQVVTFGDGATIQSATIASTGTVTFNVTAATLATVAVGDLDGTISAAEALQTFAAAAAATAVVNVTGAGGVFGLIADSDLVLTNIDTVNINTTTASTIVAASLTTDSMAQVLNLGTVAGHIVHLDTAGTQSGTVSITGFQVGTGGDTIALSTAVTANIAAGSLTSENYVVTTGATIATVTAVADAVSLFVLGQAAAQISGVLTNVNNAGATEAAIIAAALITDDAAGNIYVALDNGVDTGIYRMAFDGAAGTALIIDHVNDIGSLVLIAVLVGVSDASTLTAANFS
jgi:hypothetical protein